ncbi:MAG: hypothetical protein NWE89_09100 [Candidatus Bathyarchaeota archaeon]|nr:hypothetical protein [Candidatus Bathyarchaeota archaeon]
MKRNYLPIAVVVLVLGVGLSFYPMNIEISLMDEIVTPWNETTTTEKSFYGSDQEFTFRTGKIEMVDGFGPSLEIISANGEIMNASAVNFDDTDAFIVLFNESQPVLEFFIEESATYDLEIEGVVFSEDATNVTATFTYFRHMKPESYTIYPYRFFGYGMAGVGVIASAIAYMLNKRQE